MSTGCSEGLSAEAGLPDVVIHRAEADWALVLGQIAEAEKAEQPLDDAFIEETARQRLASAEADYSYARGAPGPTMESSRAIVRDIFELHQIATEVGTPESAGSTQPGA